MQLPKPTVLMKSTKRSQVRSFLPIALKTPPITEQSEEKDIMEDLKASDQFISDTAEIESCEIIKRQTNTENGTDEVYVTVEGGNDELSFTLSYILTYELYNEGSFLESVAS